MSLKSEPDMGINSWLEDELYQQYLHDRTAVDESWKRVFEENGGSTAAPAPVSPAPASPASAPPAATPPPAADVELQPLRGAAGRIAENMAASLAIPLATSQRTIAVKVMDENRRVINQHRGLVGRSKVSYTHIIGWALVKALEDVPALNHAYYEKDGQPFRVIHKHVNLGIAVDVAGRDGARSLMVPNIKNAGNLNFQEYLTAFDDLVSRARTAKLTPADFQATTLSLTNPGTVGTMSSTPRLMPGQGAIIATGAIDYPAEYRGAAEETRAVIGVSKVMTITCTYDHRIIQGAESGAFLGKVQELLDGNDGFYEEIFEHLRMPHQPVRWVADRQSQIPGLTAARYNEIAKEAGIIQMINAYRVRGHLIADLDPLGIEPSYHPELDPVTYGLTIWDLDREFLTGSLGESIGEGGPKPVATLREILETLRQTYCGKIGCEYMNIQVPEQKRWLQHRMEPEANNWPLDRDQRVRILRDLIAAEEFEHFLHSRFVGQKRFSLEGGETAHRDHRRDCSSARPNDDVHEIVMGMAHRGRLNVLANVVGKGSRRSSPNSKATSTPPARKGSGDVKYHLGATGIRKTVERHARSSSPCRPIPATWKPWIRWSKASSGPSRTASATSKRERVIPLLIHGDAAFAGQGVVAETLNLSQLDGYSTGGTIHLIINNQIGFTTLPDEARSTPYSHRRGARGAGADLPRERRRSGGCDPGAWQLAFDYRQQFKKDVVIDMICYRRHGHNEGDDPSYTQPHPLSQDQGAPFGRHHLRRPVGARRRAGSG